MKRVKSGISGLDPFIQGGLPKGSVVLVSGAPGTGKTILCLQYLYEGAKSGDKGLYISFEQTEKDLQAQAKQFGWNIKKVLNKNLFFKHFDVRKKVNLISEIEKVVKKLKPNRLVIDSLSTLLNHIPLGKGGVGDYSLEEMETSLIPVLTSEDILIRITVHDLIETLKRFSCTTLVTSEIPADSGWLSRDTISEFLVDGVITLHYLGIGSRDFRSLKVVKMRQTKHKEGFVPFEFAREGIEVREKEKFKV